METTSNKEGQFDHKDFTEDVKDYLNLRMQIIRLNITEKVSTALSGMISGSILVILYLLTFLFTFTALAFWLGNLLNHVAAGFACVAGFSFLLAIIFRIRLRNFKSKLADKFIEDFSNDDDGRN